LHEIVLCFLNIAKVYFYQSDEFMLKIIFLRHFYFQLYDDAFKRNTEIPSYWHKNFALVCERMLHIESEFDKTDMLKKVILHFELFLMQHKNRPHA
jgi:hypothetical protein